MKDTDLTPQLQAELDRRHGDLNLKAWWPDSASWSAVERGERMAQVSAALDGVLPLALWAEGVEHLTGSADSLAIAADAISEWLSESHPGSEAIASKFAFLEVEPLARAYEQGEAIEYLWHALLESPPSESLRPLIEEASGEPGLRRLRPWTSMDRLCFSRWVGWPVSDDLPYAAPRQGRFQVFRPNDDGYLSEADEYVLGEGDAGHAVDLLAAALPQPLELIYRRPSSR